MADGLDEQADKANSTDPLLGRSEEPASPSDAMAKSRSDVAPVKSLTGTKVAGCDDEWHYCVVFKRSARAGQAVKGPMRVLERIFQRQVLLDWEPEEYEKFKQASMPQSEFVNAVWCKLLELLKGSQCGFEVGFRPSIDEDEMFLLIKLVKHETIEQLADHFEIIKAITSDAYLMHGMTCPTFSPMGYSQWWACLSGQAAKPKPAAVHMKFRTEFQHQFREERDRLLRVCDDKISELLSYHHSDVAREASDDRTRIPLMAMLADRLQHPNSPRYVPRDAGASTNDADESSSEAVRSPLNMLHSRVVAPLRNVSAPLLAVSASMMGRDVGAVFDELCAAIEAGGHDPECDEDEIERRKTADADEVRKTRLDRWSRVSVESLQAAEFYEPFEELDVLRIVNRSIAAVANMHAMQEQGLIRAYFPLHSQRALQPLQSEWAALRRILVIPSGRHINAVRAYFGEEVAFYFSWINFETRKLLLPAAMALIAEYDFNVVQHYKRLFDMCFAVVMVLWVAYVGASYTQLAARKALEWGLSERDVVGFALPSFDPKMRGRRRILTLRIVHWALVLLFLGETVWVAMEVSKLRGRVKRFEEEGQELPFFLSIFAEFSNYVTVANIKLVAFLWGLISPCITALENHRTDLNLKNAQVYKDFVVLSVVNYYPFIYLAFIKPRMEGADRDECLARLGANLQLYFVFEIVTSVAMILYSLGVKRYSECVDRTQAAKLGKKDGVHTDAEEQAWREEYSGDTQAFMSLLLTMGLIAMFCVIKPIIAFFALFSNMILTRVEAWKMANVLQRPAPRVRAGIGPWQGIITIISCLAGFTCVALCLFALEPPDSVKVLPGGKWLAFLAGEHIIFFFIYCIQVFFPKQVPKDELVIEQHSQMRLQLLNKVRLRLKVEEGSEQRLASFSDGQTLPGSIPADASAKAPDQEVKSMA